jgi:hypothetical protein
LWWETPLEGPPSRGEALPLKSKYRNLLCEPGLSRLNPAAAFQTLKDDELNEPRRTKFKVYTPCTGAQGDGTENRAMTQESIRVGTGVTARWGKDGGGEIVLQKRNVWERGCD